MTSFAARPASRSSSNRSNKNLQRRKADEAYTFVDADARRAYAGVARARLERRVAQENATA
jgi:hypothetical protein